MKTPYCIAILLFFLYVETQGKPGICPRPRYVASSLADNDRWCNTDDDCDGDKKCCPHANGTICKTPAANRPGICPRTWRTGRCNDHCTSDSECAPGLKCCFVNCGFQCVPPPGVPDGFCPAARPYVPICFVPCKSCPKGQKCCPNRCRDECVPALPEKPGSCPPPTVFCIRGSFQACANDKTCPGQEKCCPYSCGQGCLPPS